MGRSLDVFSSSETDGTVFSAGNYEYPFEFSIPGDTIETVAGIPEASTTYKLEASVMQSGLSQDIRAVKAVRIIRTLTSWAPANLHTIHIEETLPDKMQYSILIPQREIAYGGTIPLEMRFACLQKGLKVEKIDVTLVEARDFFLRAPHETVNKHQKTNQVASTWTFEVEHEGLSYEEADGFSQGFSVVSKNLELPRTLEQCIQDLRYAGLQVRHELSFTVCLKDHDGNTLQTNVSSPIRIFMTQNTTFDESGKMTSQEPAFASAEGEPSHEAPPSYPDHLHDQRNDEIGSSASQASYDTTDTGSIRNSDDRSRPSIEDIGQPASHLELNRVPSYGTAVRATTTGRPNNRGFLPSYAEESD
ncbi:arrestin [Colletotrichum karsti]|uniref:Arrestin n=1 Tax=Colletotrichum karsti TaxID=1095194 RepID=A0A9P6LH74_9PEZI|nr:arrestin [Colletotrichum karsti]KAF9872325.1 arrestin [Colletotrichum karsti]